jgi:LPS-assembly protein
LRREPDTTPRRIGARTRLLAGAALAVWSAAGVAQAQVAPAPAQTPVAEQPADGLSPDAVYVDAAQASRQGDVITASGDANSRLLARTCGHTLQAKELQYDLGQGTGAASGEVELTSPRGDVVFASHIELQEDLTLGVAVDFATRLQDGSSVMAATAVRRSAEVNELNYALFTPCPICDVNGPKTPSLAVQAEKVIQDEDLRAILFKNATIKVGGVPVVWLPAFAIPDPTVERASGLLTPIINYDEGRGVSVETPYLHVFSPSEDWLFSPQFNTRVSPFLNVQWRQIGRAHV